ncbi:MAG: FAD-dependent oxidoreductase [Clostridia bacterium]|nr:FAD-dependent oxidoreductase [Clostridia bacterium]
MKQILTADVAVVGGGFGGIAAALSAARKGAKTVLVEREYLLGGLATLGLVTIYLPLCDGEGRQVSFGIAEELFRLSIDRGAEGEYPDAWLDAPADLEKRKTQRYRVRFNPNLFAILAEQLLLKAGVKILYGVQIEDVAMADGRIVSAEAHSRTGGMTIESKTWIDATGDATLANLAGEETRLFAQGNVLAAWYYDIKDGSAKLHQLGAADIPDEYRKDKESKPLVERRFTGLDAEELSEMVIASHNCILSDCDKRGVTPVAIASIPQVRMSRCLVASRVLDDKAPHTYEPTSVGMISNWRKRGPVYEVPFELCYGKVENLYAAGRCISVTDAMWDITRVIPPCAVTGEAVGCAAAMQAETGARPSAEALQKVLTANGVVLHESDLA